MGRLLFADQPLKDILEEFIYLRDRMTVEFEEILKCEYIIKYGAQKIRENKKLLESDHFQEMTLKEISEFILRKYEEEFNNKSEELQYSNTIHYGHFDAYQEI